MEKNIFIVVLLFYISISSIFGQVAIGTGSPDNSSVLDLQSTSQGLLLPRMNTIQQLQIDNPALGLLIFNLDSLDFWFFKDEYWICMQDLTDTLFLTDWFCGMEISYQGQSYSTVLIGTQCWMAENLNVGLRINCNENQTNDGIIQKYCNDNNESNCDIFGGLYQWSELMQYTEQDATQGICPDGWHIPSAGDWTLLKNYLGGSAVAGGKMKSTGTIQDGTGYWQSPNEGATNESGFTALPADRVADNYCAGVGTSVAYFFSSTEWNSDCAYYGRISYFSAYFDWISCSLTKSAGMSVRCVLD